MFDLGLGPLEAQIMTLHADGRLGLSAVAGALAVSLTLLSAQQPGGDTVAIDPDDIGGVVTSTDGPEAGVWVIAETTDLPTTFARMVVTDDLGRYVLPDLPDASYEVFVRGYGLVDSARVRVMPGQMLDLAAVVAPDARAAAEIYLANYWLALLEVPRGPRSPMQVTTSIKICFSCHQVGNKATRELPANLGTFGSSLEAWDHRVGMGPMGSFMNNIYRGIGPQRAMFADWTDRIAAGELPRADPPRPAGHERSLVISWWEWGTPTTFTHTPAATDKRDPTINANGRVYGPDRAHDTLVWVDPVEHTVGEIEIPKRDLDIPNTSQPLVPSTYWGEELIWKGVGEPRSGAMDEKGRVWFATKIRANENHPDYCKSGSSNRYAQYFPIERGGKQAAFYDPASDQMTLVDTCFTTDHNDFAEDEDDSIYFGEMGSGVVGWINTRIFDETQDEEAAQGWCPGVLDTNGDGTISTGWTEPDQAIDPTRDHRITFGCYSVCGALRSWADRQTRAGTQSTGDLQGRGVHPTGRVSGPGRRWHLGRQRRRGLDELARDGPPDELRPTRVSRLERPNRHRRPLSRGVAGVSKTGSDLRRDDRQRRPQLSDLRGSPQHAGCRAQRADDPGGQFRFGDRGDPRHRGMGHAAGSVPDRIPRARGARTDRRPERGVEGSRLMVERYDLHRLASRRWKGFEAAGDQVSGPARPARQIGWGFSRAIVGRGFSRAEPDRRGGRYGEAGLTVTVTSATVVRTVSSATARST